MNQPDPSREEGRPPLPLDYQRPRVDEWIEPVPPKWLQFLFGVGAWAIFAGLMAGVVRFFPNRAGIFSAFCVGLIVLAVIDLQLRSRFRWTTFSQGVILGIGLTCLIPAITCFFM